MVLDATHVGGRVLLRYRNREVTEADIEFLRGLCAQSWSRRVDVAHAVCAAWDWRQVNGSPSRYACYDLLLRLEERGLIELPEPARKRPRRRKGWLSQLPIPVELIPLVGLPLRDPDADLKKLVIRPIEAEERLGFRVYMERFHPLGDRPMVGEHLMYAAFVGGDLVALLAWASAALRTVPRDRYVGWDEATKRQRLHLVTNNVRFLVLPWVRVRHLASRVLAMNLRRLSSDWQRVWNHPVLMAETFVDPSRHRGTCYRAANWQYLGETAGRFKRGNEYLHGGTKKAVYVYPLHQNATRVLREPLEPKARAQG